MRRVYFTPVAQAQLNEWAVTNKKIYNKIVDLVNAIQKEPFSGMGKPEPLKHQLKGYWSRRIDKVHRLVYEVTKDSIIVIACKRHY